jgi:hypothetical protein
MLSLKKGRRTTLINIKNTKQGGLESMRNLKKYLAVALTVAMMTLAIAPAAVFANSEYSDEAQALYELGLYKGLSETEFVPDLDSTLDRQTGAVMILRMFGLEEEALLLSYEEAREILRGKFSDADEVAEWAVRQVAYATEQGVIAGFPGGTFGPTLLLTGRQYLALTLNMLGYDQELRNRGFDSAGELFYEVSEITISQELAYDQPNAIQKSVLVGISFEALRSTLADGSGTLAEKLVREGVISPAVAERAGVYVAPSAPVEEEPVEEEPVLEVHEVSVVTEEGVTTVEAHVANYEEGATAIVALTPAEELELGVLYFEDVEIGEEGKVSYTFEFELPAGTHSVAVWVGDVYSEVEFTIEAPAVPDQKLVEVKATAEDKIVVVFAAPVEDVSVVGFELEGPMVINPTITWNEDKTEAHLVSPGIFIEGTYTIKVTGLEFADGVDSKTLTLTENGVARIEVLGDKLVRISDTEGEVVVKLFDSYGNDVTEKMSYDVTINSSRQSAEYSDSKKGIVTVETAGTWNNFPITPELVTVTVYANTAVGGRLATASAVLSVTELSRVDKVELSQVVLPSGYDSLTLGKSDAGYVVLKAYDQFGREVEDVDTKLSLENEAASDVFYSVSDSVVKNDMKVLKETNDDGEDEIRIKLDLNNLEGRNNVKRVTLQVISKYTAGSSNVVNLDLKEGRVPYRVVMGSPENIVAVGDTYDETIIIPITVYDEDGNVLSADEVADEEDKINITSGQVDFNLKVATSGEFKGKIVGNTVPATDGLKSVVVSVKDSPAVSSTLTVNVRKVAEARTIRLAQTPASNLLFNSNTEFSYEFIDQYGRVMEDAMLDAQNTKVWLTLSNTSRGVLHVGGVAAAVTTSEIQYQASDLSDKDDVKISAKTDDGSFTLKAELRNPANTSTVSTVTRTFNVAKGVPSSLNFTIEAVPTIYADATTVTSIYARELKVSATDANGNTYAVPADRIINVATSDDNYVDVKKEGDDVIVYGSGNWANDNEVKTAVITLQIATDSGPKAVQTTVTVSEVAPKVQTIWFIDKAVTDPQELPSSFKVVSELAAREVDGHANTDAVKTVYLVTVDQYGIYTQIDAATPLLVSNSDKASNDILVHYEDNSILLVTGTLEKESTIVLIYTEDGVTGTINVRTGNADIVALP